MALPVTPVPPSAEPGRWQPTGRLPVTHRPTPADAQAPRSNGIWLIVGFGVLLGLGAVVALFALRSGDDQPTGTTVASSTPSSTPSTDAGSTTTARSTTAAPTTTAAAATTTAAPPTVAPTTVAPTVPPTPAPTTPPTPAPTPPPTPAPTPAP